MPRTASACCGGARCSPLTAALSLAIGIGANTAIFTVANSLLFRPPAGIADPSELVVIGTARGDGGLNPLGYAAYLELAAPHDVAPRRSSRKACSRRVMGMAASGTATAEAVLGHSVTTNYFAVLGVLPARGRLFAEGDGNAAVLNHDYWTRRLGGDDSVVGRTLQINGQPVTVVGVAAPGFQGTGVRVVRRVAGDRARRRRQRRRRRPAAAGRAARRRRGGSRDHR